MLNSIIRGTLHLLLVCCDEKDNELGDQYTTK